MKRKFSGRVAGAVASAGSVHQRGTAVIAALLVAFAAAAAAGAVLERQNLLADTLINERERAQAHWVLRGGLDWARVVLYGDSARNTTTRLDGVWAQPIVGLSVNDFVARDNDNNDNNDNSSSDQSQAYFSGRIEDEQGKVNLRHLVAHGEIVAHEVEALERLFAALDVPPELAHRIAQRMLDGTPGEDTPARAVGVSRLDDVLPGADDAYLRALRPFLAVLPVAAPLNVNTASAEAISTVLPEVSLAWARELVAQRDRGLWFTHRADFFNRLGKNPQEGAARIVVRSDWFLVTGEVTLNQVTAGMQALLQRQGGQPPAVRWRVQS